MFFFDSKPANSGQDGKLRGRRWLWRESAMHVRLGLEVQGHRLYISAASEEGNRDASRHAWSRDLVIASWEQVSFCSSRFFECRQASPGRLQVHFISEGAFCVGSAFFPLHCVVSWCSETRRRDPLKGHK